MTLINEKMIDEKTKREINSCYILGRLADESDPDHLPALGVERKSVTKSNRNDVVVFYLQAVSDEPKLLKNTLEKQQKDCYVSFDDRNYRYLQSIKYYDQTDKVQYLREHLEGKLILFKPKLSVRNDNTGHRYHYNFDIVLVSEDAAENNYYVAVPQVKKGVPAARFERSLVDKSPVQLPEYPSYMEVPEFILCDGQLYFIPEQDILETGNNINLYYARKPHLIKKLPLSELQDFWDHMKCAYRELGFLPDQYAGLLRDKFHHQGKSIVQNEALAAAPKKEEKAKMPETLSESDFISRLKFFAEDEELIYQEEEALVNFHTALKTGNMAVLGGMSGTGKTQLALLYAKALGLKKDENLLIVPISPAYTEPSDILGYHNHQMGLYMESETGLVSFLERASRNKNELHMVLFDEMNLGQVEHYFSPFVSLLEMPKDQRELQLFSKDAICHNKNQSRVIPIQDNVLFVGTANFDETTKDFSNRMLDRMNVIFLEKLGFGASLEKETETKDFDRQTKVNRKIYREDWLSKPASLEEHEISLLDRLHELMREYDSQAGVSFRIAKGIGMYLSNIPEVSEGNPFVTRQTGLDYQIKQRILTKIRGHREQIQELVGTYELDSNKYQPGLIARLLMEEGDGEEEFKSSINFLKQKAKEITRNGYAL
ncbi:McrB family protein [Paenibacillus allorhizosphaerae]|uniref:ATPase dynein-related AAA domain-containing protein n=1 Tax=Paenibacillus allorhizosphaerae TaxID=2849866 RepID=A0ABM8VNM5_9BACL|nr:AAA family ATPase [Paenibacillus allorhizosphaerae]CAG7651699.1 hypothetical protein PAECIP111802_05029 [Paenibacillus allorhizosphaerae]